MVRFPFLVSVDLIHPHTFDSSKIPLVRNYTKAYAYILEPPNFCMRAARGKHTSACRDAFTQLVGNIQPCWTSNDFEVQGNDGETKSIVFIDAQAPTYMTYVYFYLLLVLCLVPCCCITGIMSILYALGCLESSKSGSFTSSWQCDVDIPIDDLDTRKIAKKSKYVHRLWEKQLSKDSVV
jgi:hypothetical protein